MKAIPKTNLYEQPPFGPTKIFHHNKANSKILYLIMFAGGKARFEACIEDS